MLLILRGREPFAGSWALPGGFMEMDEPFIETARRELREETGLTAPPLQFLTLRDAPGRDPRGRVITVVFWGMVSEDASSLQAADDAAQAKWFDVNQLPPLAFDHEAVVTLARAALGERRARMDEA